MLRTSSRSERPSVASREKHHAGSFILMAGSPSMKLMFACMQGTFRNHRAVHILSRFTITPQVWGSHMQWGHNGHCTHKDRLTSVHVCRFFGGGGFPGFGGFGGMGEEEETTPKGHDVHVELEVTLNDLYLGHQYKACPCCNHFEVVLTIRILRDVHYRIWSRLASFFADKCAFEPCCCMPGAGCSS